MDAVAKGIVRRALPSPNADAGEVYARMGRFQEAYVLNPLPQRLVAADEGSYFIAQNPTPGTAIQLNANITSFADTNGLFLFKNTQSASTASAKRIYLDYIKLIVAGTAPTATVSMHFAFKRGTTDRTPSSSSAYTTLTPINACSEYGNTSICTPLSFANAAAMTLIASGSSEKFTGRATIPTGLGVTGDEYMVKFGGEPVASGRGGAAVRATDPGQIFTYAPPQIIEPAEFLAVHMWWLTAASTAASFEFEVGWWER